jgi:hypothetical protein
VRKVRSRRQTPRATATNGGTKSTQSNGKAG